MYGGIAVKFSGRPLPCCFTGHRHIPAREMAGVQAFLEQTIEEMIARGVRVFNAGGAFGFDMLAEETVLATRARHPEKKVQLHLLLPCRWHDKYWQPSDKARMRAIVEQADFTRCLADYYYDGCMAKRNEFLVNCSGICVYYLRHFPSGTAQTVDMARRARLVMVGVPPAP